MLAGVNKTRSNTERETVSCVTPLAVNYRGRSSTTNIVKIERECHYYEGFRSMKHFSDY